MLKILSAKKLKDMNLSLKIAGIASIMLTVIFTIFIVFTVLSSKGAISEAIEGEFDTRSKSNANQVQQIIDSATTAANNMTLYLDKIYLKKARSKENMSSETLAGEQASLETSLIYKVAISKLSADVEQYAIESARDTVLSNPDIVGVGIMFEPYQFDKNLKDFAFYIDENSADEKVTPYGTYSEFSKEDFYSKAAQEKTMVMTEPYEHEGIRMVTVAKPILYNNTVMGVVMVDINVTNFSKMDAKNENYPTMYATIYNENGMIVFDTENAEDIGKQMESFFTKKDEYEQIETMMSKGKAFSIETTREGGRKVTRFMNPIQAGNGNWWALMALDTKDMNKSVNSTMRWLIGMSVLALLIIVMTLVVVLKRMLNPINDLVKAAESIAQGNLNVNLEAKTNDEIGQLANAFDVTAKRLQSIIVDENYLLNEMANGNFNVKTKAEEVYIGDFSPLLLSIHNINARLSDTLWQINQASDQVASGAEQVSSGAQALSQGATEQASSIEELAATINEISEQVRQNAANALEGSEKANTVGNEMMESNQQMKQMIQAMTEISNSSNEIGKIIKTIEDIAFQTNILALNAAVEAARAGEAGKGFAVVADEVRNLASKSAEASKNTSALIEGSMKAVENGTRIADETAKSLILAVEGSKDVANTIDRISEASRDQSSSISQVTQGVDQISSVVQTNSATAEESAAASEELSGQAIMLKDLVSRFKLKSGEDAIYEPILSNQEPDYEPTPSYQELDYESAASYEEPEILREAEAYSKY